MLKNIVFIVVVLFHLPIVAQKVDVLIVGGGASGTAAGIQAARMGARTLIVEETTWLGGMLTSAGVSAVDGNYKMPSGIFGEFKDSLIAYYGSADALKTGWVSNVLFEPKVGNKLFQQMVLSEKKLSVLFETKFISAKKTKRGWHVILLQAGKKIKVQAKRVVDATELGDVAKAIGIKYDIGMDSRASSGEDIAPEKENDIIQDLTYVMILKDYGFDKTISKPEGYNASLFYCTAKSPNCTQPKPGQALWSPDQMMRYGKLPNGKYMINWPIEGNDFHINMLEMNDKERSLAYEKAKQFSLCYLFYLQTELGFSNFGLDEEQFPTADHFPLIPYHRESRRIHGLVRFNVNHAKYPFLQSEALYRTGIGVGDYPIDHHHKRYPEWNSLPKLHLYPIPSYNVPLGIMVPKEHEDILVAEKSVSVSNILNGSTRLQPVVLQIGQAAGALAVLSINSKTSLSNTSVRAVQQVLLDAGVYLMPYLDLHKSDVHFKAIQRIGATGIIRGEGKNVGWSNETWFNTDENVRIAELKQGMLDFEPAFHWTSNNQELTVNEAIELVSSWAEFYKIADVNARTIASNWSKMHLKKFDANRNITRKELAVLLDTYIQPFSLKEVDMKGNFIK